MTFTRNMEREAHRGYQETVLPSLKESATQIAVAGLDKLLKQSYETGLSTTGVFVGYGVYGEREHRETLFKLIRRRIFVDVQVVREENGYTFKLAPVFSQGTGTLSYREPIYRVQREANYFIYTNVSFLKKKGVRDLRSRAFFDVCDFFNLKERCTPINYNYDSPVGIDCCDPSDYLNLIEVVMRWAQRNSNKILLLHELGNPARVYDQLNFRLEPKEEWTEGKMEGCLAQLDELLP